MSKTTKSIVAAPAIDRGSGVAVRTEELRLTYPGPLGTIVGVGTGSEGLTFEVPEGEIFGIIGPDGAGKTTLIRLLCSLLLPESGRAWVAGFDTQEEYSELRRHIGYMPGTFSLYGDLTVAENLHFFATIFGTTVEEHYHLVSDIYSQIEPFRDRKAKSLSGGMKQKLALSCALIHSPRVLFLDEPTTGIDPISRVELWDMLSKLSTEGVTVVASTAYMEEAARCQRIAYMKGGHFVTTGVPQQIPRDYPYPLYSVRGTDMLYLLQSLRRYPDTVSAFAFGDALHLSLRHQDESGAVQDFLQSSCGISEALQIERLEPTLEDVFLLLDQELEEGEGM